jgi:Mrp family chromosome partitioning ATPase
MKTKKTHTTKQARTGGRRSGRGGDVPLALRSRAGELLHVSLPVVSSTLRATIARLRLADELPATLGVVSAMRGEGVTYISRSLALVLANDSGADVCVVDLNWRTPAAWGGTIDTRPGLADVVRGTASLDDVIVPTAERALSIVPAGRTTLDEVPVFAAGSTLASVLADLGRRFDHLVLDVPALHAAPEALTLAAHADAVAVVVRQGVTAESQVASALDELDGVPVLGVVLNDYSTKVPKFIMQRVPTP